eukprot:TRINITY_DN3384_c0_g1_i1.p1 TRINITY_DN3384_c0_g1~~TRINITY_DN3384_c0_g1_i1.p1  ORF type:complete len:112 (-),score=1.63 TRINITY_DN3384_c0_g1_i1:34-369(-)
MHLCVCVCRDLVMSACVVCVHLLLKLRHKGKFGLLTRRHEFVCAIEETRVLTARQFAVAEGRHTLLEASVDQAVVGIHGFLCLKLLEVLGRLFCRERRSGAVLSEIHALIR